VSCATVPPRRNDRFQGLRLRNERGLVGGGAVLLRCGLVTIVRLVSGHRLGEGIPKALEEKGRVKTAIWTTLASLFGKGKGRVIHGEGRILGVKSENPDTLRMSFSQTDLWIV
jgi:hypothetical protein